MYDAIVLIITLLNAVYLANKRVGIFDSRFVQFLIELNTNKFMTRADQRPSTDWSVVNMLLEQRKLSVI